MSEHPFLILQLFRKKNVRSTALQHGCSPPSPTTSCGMHNFRQISGENCDPEALSPCVCLELSFRVLKALLHSGQGNLTKVAHFPNFLNFPNLQIQSLDMVPMIRASVVEHICCRLCRFTQRGSDHSNVSAWDCYLVLSWHAGLWQMLSGMLFGVEASSHTLSTSIPTLRTQAFWVPHSSAKPIKVTRVCASSLSVDTISCCPVWLAMSEGTNATHVS